MDIGILEINYLVKYGVTFLFTFAIIFGLLELIGKKSQKGFFPKRVNILIALLFGAVAISFEPVTIFLWGIMPIATIILTILFFFAFFTKLFEEDGGKKNVAPLIVTLGILLLIISITWERIISSLSFHYLSPTDLLWIIGLVIVCLMFYAAYMGKSDQQDNEKSILLLRES